MVRTFVIRASIAAATILTLCSTAFPANQLVNPGFEDPITDDGPPFIGFWEAFSGDGNQATGPDIARNSILLPRSGVQSLELIINSTPNTFAGVLQDVPVGPSAQTSLTGWHRSDGPSSDIEIRIEWRDSVSDSEISRTPNLTPTPGAAYEMFTLDVQAPVGADIARIVYAIQSFGGAIDQQVFVDDMAFDPTVPVELMSFSVE